MSNSEQSSKGKSYNFTAIVERRNSKDVHRFGYVRLLLREVRFNGTLLFRDHVWIRDDKRTAHLTTGDSIHFTARLKPYMDSSDIKSTKLGLVLIRNVKQFYRIKKFNMNYDACIPRTKLRKNLRRYKLEQERKKAAAIASN